jgi:hypothetical protein
MSSPSLNNEEATAEVLLVLSGTSMKTRAKTHVRPAAWIGSLLFIGGGTPGPCLSGVLGWLVAQGERRAQGLSSRLK